MPGLNTHAGHVTYKAVAEAHGMPYQEWKPVDRRFKLPAAGGGGRPLETCNVQPATEQPMTLLKPRLSAKQAAANMAEIEPKYREQEALVGVNMLLLL